MYLQSLFKPLATTRRIEHVSDGKSKRKAEICLNNKNQIPFPFTWNRLKKNLPDLVQRGGQGTDWRHSVTEQGPRGGGIEMHLENV